MTTFSVFIRSSLALILLTGVLACTKLSNREKTSGGTIGSKSFSEPSSGALEVQTAKDFVLPLNQSVLVLPLTFDRRRKGIEQFSEIEQFAEIEQAKLAELSISLADTIDRRTSLDIVNNSNPTLAANLISRAPKTGSVLPSVAMTPNESELILRARESGIRHLVISDLLNFDELRGSKFGAEAPASVSFRIRIVDTSNGATVVKMSYSYRDTSVAENLLNFKNKVRSGLGFADATTLLKQGFVEVANSINSLKSKR